MYLKEDWSFFRLSWFSEQDRIELVRTARWYGKGRPLVLVHHFAQIDHLPYVIGIVGQLPVQGGHKGKFLVSDRNGLVQLGFRDGVHGGK